MCLRSGADWWLSQPAKLKQKRNVTCRKNYASRLLCQSLFCIKEAFLVLMVCAPVFIFTSGSSALDLLGRPRRVVYWCHCRYLPYSINFSEFISFFSLRENRQNTKILEVRHFRMIRNWPPTVIGRAKHQYWELLRILWIGSLFCCYLYSLVSCVANVERIRYLWWVNVSFADISVTI